MRRALAKGLGLAVVLLAFGSSAPTPAAASTSCLTVTPPVGAPFFDCANHQVFNILPPGSNGLANAADAIQARQGSAPHEADQLPMYANLKKVAPNLTDASLSQYYKDATFAVWPSDIDHVDTLNNGNTVIVWDKSFGVPHIYGKTRDATEFGVGYAAAEQRLFLMDVLRHIGRSRLSQFLGPSPTAYAEDCSIAQVAGYSEPELTWQANLLPKRYTTPFNGTTEGQQVFNDGTSYVNGINAYIQAATTTRPDLLPAEYALVAPGQNRPQPWAASDIVAVAAIVQSIFAVGGGDEVDSWLLYRALAAAYHSDSKALQIWQDLRRQNDPSAPTTLSQSFPYMDGSNSNQTDVTKVPGLAQLSADPGSPGNYVCSEAPKPGSPTLGGAPRMHVNLPPLVPGKMPLSNALLVDAAHSAGGHPTAVFGPQVAYFAPEILHEEDVHGPGIDARGASFPGTDIYVELGRGIDYAWSATSASSDLIDRRAELLCNQAGSTTFVPGSANSTNYWYNGACRSMYERTDVETALSSPAAPNPPQIITFKIERTVHGPVIGRTTAACTDPVCGALKGQQVPIAISYQRSTWFDELGSAAAFMRWNDPDVMHGAHDFFVAAGEESGTFNWHYLDSRDIAYYSSGLLPQRPSTVNPNFPSWATSPQFDWLGLATIHCGVATPPGPDRWGALTSGSNQPATCGYTADWLKHDGSSGGSNPDPHPHYVNPPSGFLAQWNNKPAPDWSAADNNFGYGSLYRVLSLSDRIKASMARGPVSKVDLVNDMEDGGSVDLHGSKLISPFVSTLPPSPSLTPEEQQVVAILQSWWANGFGAHRRAPAGLNYPCSGNPSVGCVEPYYDNGSAVAIMDKLYPNLVHAIFDPWFATGLYNRIFALKPLYDYTPYQGRGSAYDESSGGWESYVNTALSQVHNSSLPDAYTQVYCGSAGGGANGSLSSCQAAMKAALDKTIQELTAAYGSSDPSRWDCKRTNDTSRGQCNPSVEDIIYSSVGLDSVSNMAWINRPTFQQVVQFSTSRAEQPSGAVSSQSVGLPGTGGTPGQDPFSWVLLVLLAIPVSIRLASWVFAARGTR